MKIDVREYVMEKVAEEIKKGLEEGKTHFDVAGICPSDFEDVLSRVGFSVGEVSDFNGWQCDYWCSATKDGVKWAISGGAWYGDCSICIDEEEC